MDETCNCPDYAGESPTCPVHTYLGRNTQQERSVAKSGVRVILDDLHEQFKPTKKYERLRGKLYVEIISMDGILYRSANWLERLTHRHVK